MVDALQRTLDAHDVKACLFSTTLSNPLGVTMPEDKRAEIVKLIEDRELVLIEDDVYGDLMFDGNRPKPAEFYSRSGRVLTCGSFSKTAAPGYRIGWLLMGRYAERDRTTQALVFLLIWAPSAAHAERVSRHRRLRPLP